MKGRVIIDAALPGAINMAKDEAIARACDEGITDFPTIRFYWWQRPTLSLGAKERLAEAADLDKCKEMGIDLVRRATGGRAVLHDKELTYSVIAPLNKKPFNSSVEESYKAIAEALREGIAAAGVELELTAGSRKIKPRTMAASSSNLDMKAAAMRHLPCFAAPSRYELAFRGRKCVGSAQRRLKKALLQHGSIIFLPEVERLALATGSDSNRLDELQKTMTGLQEITGKTFDRAKLVNHLIPAFSHKLGYNFQPGNLLPAEKAKLKDLIPVVENRL